VDGRARTGVSGVRHPHGDRLHAGGGPQDSGRVTEKAQCGYSGGYNILGEKNITFPNCDFYGRSTFSVIMQPDRWVRREG
jgi:hypothetical protein